MTKETTGSLTQTTGARQTMKSWARTIDSFENVPAIYQPAFQSLTRNISTHPYTVFAPAQVVPSGQKSTEALLVEVNNTFYALQQVGGQIVTTGFHYADIASLEIGNILLYSWFSISGKTITGVETTLNVKFNEATLGHFTPFFQNMRPARIESDPDSLNREYAKFNALQLDNFKFASYVRESLVPGERAIRFVYQPQKRQKIIGLLGHELYRTLFLTHLVLLTDKEIILISDTEQITKGKISKYGGVWRYLPLRQIGSVAVSELPGDRIKLTVVVSPAIQMESLFDASRLAELQDFKQAVDALIR